MSRVGIRLCWGGGLGVLSFWMACSSRAMPEVIGVRVCWVIVLANVAGFDFVGEMVAGFATGFGVGVRLCQMLFASGRRMDGSVTIGSVPRRKKIERGGLVKSDGLGDVIGVV